jgi:hypothetical protein
MHEFVVHPISNSNRHRDEVRKYDGPSVQTIKLKLKTNRPTAGCSGTIGKSGNDGPGRYGLYRTYMTLNVNKQATQYDVQ